MLRGEDGVAEYLTGICIPTTPRFVKTIFERGELPYYVVARRRFARVGDVLNWLESTKRNATSAGDGR
ncbi:hypothetical protein BH683_017640 [Williamsia sp. 1138]|nr:hypothetical protein BH683_017640 [Williamsia sp. 1138]